MVTLFTLKSEHENPLSVLQELGTILTVQLGTPVMLRGELPSGTLSLEVKVARDSPKAQTARDTITKYGFTIVSEKEVED